MKKTAVAILLFAAAVSATTAEARKTTPETIYRKGWIDFNKNGRMDPYEDPSRSLDERVEDLLGRMTLEEKSCQLATLYGYGRVLRDSLPTAEWKNEVWKDGIANIDEMLNGVGKSLRTTPHLVSDYTGHVEAKNTIQRWFVEQTRLGIPAEFTNEGIIGLSARHATSCPMPLALGMSWDPDLSRVQGRVSGVVTHYDIEVPLGALLEFSRSRLVHGQRERVLAVVADGVERVEGQPLFREVEQLLAVLEARLGRAQRFEFLGRVHDLGLAGEDLVNGVKRDVVVVVGHAFLQQVEPDDRPLTLLALVVGDAGFVARVELFAVVALEIVIRAGFALFASDGADGRDERRVSRIIAVGVVVAGSKREDGHSRDKE